MVQGGTDAFVDFEAPNTEFDWVQVSTGDGFFMEGRPDACIVVDNGDGTTVGNVYGPSFGLRWDTEDEFTLGWNYGEGTAYCNEGID